MNGGEEKKETGANDKNEKQCEVLMWGYFPGVTAQRSPLTSPVTVRFPDGELAGNSWKDVCAGGCGFGMAISGCGKLITWGSADDQGQSYLTSGKHGETPDIYPLPTADPIIKAAAGWAHCVSVTDKGELYTWGWKECVPSGKVPRCWTSMKTREDETSTKQSSTITEPGSPQSHSTKSTSVSVSCQNDKSSGDETMKRRKVITQPEYEASIPADETLSLPPCLVNLDPGVMIASVAAGGRHTLALSDGGQVWGWGYGGEGQLGLGSRIKMVASPHLIPCIDLSSNEIDSSVAINQETVCVGAEQRKSIGNYIKGIACGGRHSAAVTDAGVLLAFGWGLYGQCGQGNTDDLLRPTCVASLLGTQIEAVAAGLWHTICIGADGRVHAFGGNQFGQLGLGTNPDQCEKLIRNHYCQVLWCEVTICKEDKQIVPKLLDASVLESKKAKVASSGARHNAILTEDGKIFCWGWNKYGQLGLGDTVDRNIPAQVLLKDYMPKNVACGWWHTLSLCEPISLKAFGEHLYFYFLLYLICFMVSEDLLGSYDNVILLTEAGSHFLGLLQNGFWRSPMVQIMSKPIQLHITRPA
ncbi:UNVERIFIED_CONTAM: Ultraviolet-B receptor UVR8 [Sesamum angustifolium]|uniref:Ultraviolet-B receptor UVR8 n=1 Tax=Sesamum angustifolium TaxID=2727405 RepID=A0AAW2MQS2_9LAMI